MSTSKIVAASPAPGKIVAAMLGDRQGLLDEHVRRHELGRLGLARRLVDLGSGARRRQHRAARARRARGGSVRVVQHDDRRGLVRAGRASAAPGPPTPSSSRTASGNTVLVLRGTDRLVHHPHVLGRRVVGLVVPRWAADLRPVGGGRRVRATCTCSAGGPTTRCTRSRRTAGRGVRGSTSARRSPRIRRPRPTRRVRCTSPRGSPTCRYGSAGSTPTLGRVDVARRHARRPTPRSPATVPAHLYVLGRGGGNEAYLHGYTVATSSWQPDWEYRRRASRSLSVRGGTA